MITITSPGGHAEARSEEWSATANSRKWEAASHSNPQSATVDSDSWSAEAECFVRVGGDPYQGEYEAAALFERQVFPTRGKTLADNFTVNAINYTEAPNESGITLTIGG